MATVTIWGTIRARRRAALVPFCLCLLLVAFACGQETGPNDAGSVSDSGGIAGADSGGAANEGGAGTNAGDGGASKADAGGMPSSGDAGSPGGDGGLGGDGGSADGSAKKSAGCGKTSTLSFKPVPDEEPGRTEGFGEGGYVEIQSSGQKRGFALRLPDNYDKEHPYPLIFGFHQRGGTAAGTDHGGDNGYNMAHYGLQKLSNNGAIFVGPHGINGGWENPRDLTFVDDMVKLISDNLCVDTTRLFANGFSWGGAMSYAIACARADVFRAVAIYDGAAISGCENGNKPIAYWQMHGLTEEVFEIGLAKPMRDKFAQNNGCTTQDPPEPPRPPPYLVNGGHICTNYAGCSSGHPLRWCVHQSGHGNAIADGTGDLYNRCANPGSTCSDSCRCTWVPADVWSFFTSL